MEPPSPFTQHFDTNYIPAASEITSIKKLIAHQQVVVDGIDGEIAKLDRRRNELVEQKRYHLEYIDKHREIISPARRLHPDILLTIFLLLASAPEPSWEHPLRTDGPIPAVVLSHVCRQWRELAVRSPLLWAYINISLPPFPIKTSPAVEGLTQGELEQYSAQLSQWKRRLAALCVQADLFVERSQGCPLHILFEAVDPRLSEDLSAEDDETHKECWRAIFQPVLRAKGGSSNQCQSLRIRIKMSNPLSPLITLLAFPQMKNKELRHLELEITYENTETSREELWEGLANKINLIDAPITSLTARMPFVDIRRIHAGWSRLTSLSIGSPSPTAHFGPQDALNFQGIRRQSVAPEQTAVSLPKLEGLTIRGSAPDVEFAAILDTPSLKRLSAMHDTDVDQSAVVEWVRRYGAQLTDVSFRYPSLTQPAFSLVMGNLVEVKNLCLDAREETPFRISLEIGGGQTAARVETPAVEYICPKLETLACVLGDGHTEATKARFIDFIEARRKAVKAGRVGYLKKVDVKFRVGPVDTMLDDLGSRGLDMQTCI
ncbi:hypothetical protein FA13DRAFT_1737963 [Coprinellus micaceus]|uniref:Uncharacterized protein n=1 Tax=Coprinellus micaceus TaxID=71717 RepID=A0A4Y7SVC8_COPMI|nr:hypothetical protein FA13DRAFT_1737963 [Coprinellus micaceus]